MTNHYKTIEQALQEAARHMHPAYKAVEPKVKLIPTAQELETPQPECRWQELTEKLARDLVDAIAADRHDYEDWPEGSFGAFVKLKNHLKGQQ